MTIKLNRCCMKPLNILCPRISPPCIDGRVEEGKWNGATQLADFSRGDGSSAHTHTTAWVARDEGYLYIAVRCEEKNTAALQQTGSPAFRDIHSRDHVNIYLNPEHDHVNYRRFSVGPYDQVEAARGSYRVGHRAGQGSRWFHTTDDVRLHPMYIRYAANVEDGNAWSFEMAIPFESLEADPPGPGTVWGLNIGRYTTWPVYSGPVSSNPYPLPGAGHSEYSSIAALAGQNPSNPFIYADLLFDADPVRLREADFGVPHFGQNRMSVRVSAPTGSDLALSATVRPREGGRIIAPETTWSMASNGKGNVTSDFTWKASHYDDTNVLELIVKEQETGLTRWRGTYEFGWESGSLPLYYLRKGETETPPPHPDPSYPDFLVKKACWIAAQQHRFHRRNTTQGAPSDFTLESSDGSVRFNLMTPDCLPQMAQYVYDSYDNDTDRLLGMLFFAGQPALIRAHPAYDPRTSDRMETLSLLRFGSGYCGHMARIMAMILNRMHSDATGQCHRARTFGIGGHGLVLVEYRDDYAILDSKHMSLYYRLDNSDLATLKEYREQPEIGRRVYPSQVPALMTFNRDHIPSNPPDKCDGSGLVWPLDAPV